jgi:tetratricopeptide (TPR) repeat protein
MTPLVAFESRSDCQAGVASPRGRGSNAAMHLNCSAWAASAVIGVTLAGCGLSEESVEAPSRPVESAHVDRPVQGAVSGMEDRPAAAADIFAIKEKSSQSLPAFESDGIAVPATLRRPETEQSSRSSNREAGMKAAAEGRHQEAIERLTSGLREDGDDVRARFVLANELAVVGKSQVALVHLKRVLAANPKEPDALVLRGMIRLKLGQFDEAADDLLAAIDRPSPSPRALAYAAMAMLELGRNDEAERLATRSLAEPGKAAAIAYQVRGHARARMHRADEAAQDLAELKELDSGDEGVGALRSAVAAARRSAAGPPKPSKP